MEALLKSHKDPESSLMFLLPNLCTTGNLFLGSLGMYMVLHDRLMHACFCIMAATILDMFDGRLARITGSESLFGAEYDSLCDLVSFGIAPGMLLYAWAFSDFRRMGWTLVFVFIACGALRLARYNASFKYGTLDKKYFRGLPIPAAANFFASLVLFSLELKLDMIPRSVLTLLLLGISLLMVSRIPFRSLRDLRFFRSQKVFNQLVLMVVVAIFILVWIEVNLFLVLSAYILANVGIFLIHWMRKWQKLSTHTQ